MAGFASVQVTRGATDTLIKFFVLYGEYMAIGINYMYSKIHRKAPLTAPYAKAAGGACGLCEVKKDRVSYLTFKIMTCIFNELQLTYG